MNEYELDLRLEHLETALVNLEEFAEKVVAQLEELTTHVVALERDFDALRAQVCMCPACRTRRAEAEAEDDQPTVH